MPFGDALFAILSAFAAGGGVEAGRVEAGSGGGTAMGLGTARGPPTAGGGPAGSAGGDGKSAAAVTCLGKGHNTRWKHVCHN